MKKVYLLFLVVIICGLMALNAETIELNPCDDMYTDVEHQGTPNAVGQLWTANYNATGHFERILIKFDLSSLDITQIEQAELVLYRFYSCASGSPTSTDFHAIAEDWDEDTWNVHQHISYHDSTQLPYVFQGQGGGSQITEFIIDITSIAEYWVSPLGQNNGLVIAARSGNKFSKFYSKEYSDVSKRPVLRLTYTGNDINVEQSIINTVGDFTSYPNPFSNTTTISYQAGSNEFVNIDIYNILGQKVKTLFRGNTDSNGLNMAWDGTNSSGSSVPKGIYFCRIKGAEQALTKKLILIK